MSIAGGAVRMLCHMQPPRDHNKGSVQYSAWLHYAYTLTSGLRTLPVYTCFILTGSWPLIHLERVMQLSVKIARTVWQILR